MTPPLIPVIRDKTIRSWPKHERGGLAYYVEAGYALERPYSSDAHFAGYSVPSVPRRLCLAAAERVDVRMVLAIFDVDAAHSHARSGGDGSPAGETWWRTTQRHLSLLPPGAFIYRTRGGCRVVYAIEPMPVDGWSERYQGWCGHLSRRFGVVADPSCCDWTRCFRAPRATRDGELQSLETIGNPYELGTWSPDVDDEDRRRVPIFGSPKKRRQPVPMAPSSYHGSGLLFYALQARGAIGQQLEPGKFSIVCPNESRHSKRTGADSSTVLWLSRCLVPEVGMVHCSHAHCLSFTLRDWLRFFDRGELDAARRAAGLPERSRVA